MKFFRPNVIIAILVIVLIAAAAFIFINRQNNSTNEAVNLNVSDSTLAADAENSGAPIPSDFTEVYNGASISGTPVPSKPPLSSYIYNGATIKNQTESHLEIESTDDPQVITDWYKKMINDLNFNAKSFSQTSSNGVVFNKLSAAKPAEKIEINIKKDQTTSIVVITVDRF